jgi:paraquat-inducible protein A
VACEFCDALQEAPNLREGEAALCGCCGELLFQNRPRSLARATAWSSAALVLMVLVHTYPFLTMRSVGMSNSLTLVGAARALAKDGEMLIACALLIFTMFAPLALMGGLLYVAAPLRHGVAAPGAVHVNRWIARFEPWSMLEVFMLGIIVSLLKLGHIAKLEFNIGVWALVGLVI